MSASLDREAAEAAAKGGPIYRWYVLAVMSLIYACHAMDRSLPNILVEPVKKEFALSDTQLGLFTGLAYGAAFCIAVLPAGWIADRVNRRNFLALAIVAWSALTAAGGLTRNWFQLLAARVGVGIGESAAVPIVLPLLSDLFPAARRSLVIGIIYMAVPLGAFLANALGGYVANEHGWRAAFFMAGIPGLLIALLLVLTIREPKRGGTDEAEVDGDPPKVSLGQSFQHYARNPGLAALLFGAVVMGLLNIIMGAWISSFFIRVHHLSLTQTGVLIGFGAGLCGIFSPLTYGWLADRLSKRNRKWALWLGAIGSLLSLIFTEIQMFTPSLLVAIGAYLIADFVRAGYTPPLYSVLLTETPARIRSSVMSIMQFTTNFFGFALGPLLTGVLSDYFGGSGGIRYALATVALLFLASSAALMLSGRLLYGRDGKAALAAV